MIRPGLRYGIVKVTNGTMTAHKGVWSWTAQETYIGPVLPRSFCLTRSV